MLRLHLPDCAAGRLPMTDCSSDPFPHVRESVIDTDYQEYVCHLRIMLIFLISTQIYLILSRKTSTGCNALRPVPSDI